MSKEVTGIVFIHGAGCDHTVWDEQVAFFGREYRCLAVDLPGHSKVATNGASSLSGVMDNVENYAAAVEDMIAGQGLNQPVIVGHSLGGAIAITMALEGPTRYRGLVLVGSGSRLRVLPALLEQFLTDFPTALDTISGLEWSETADPTRKARLRRRGEELGGQVHWADFTACDKFDASARLSELKLPAIAIVGSEDKLTPVKYSEFLRQNMPDCELALVPGAGHMLPLEQPDVLNGVLQGFLARG